MLIKSKLNAPRLLKNSVTRLHLLHDFNAIKLGLITAPAGYGKTSLLSEWANKQDGCAWFSIDKYDNNAQQFANYFIYAMADIEGVHCPATIEMVKQNSDLDLIALFTLFFNESAEQQKPLCIILDDFHHITDTSILQALSFFIKHMPNDWQLLISTRAATALPISNLRIKQQLFELSLDALSFSDQESLLFFESSLNFAMPSTTVLNLNEAVSGWPTALQLVAILSKDAQSFTEYALQIANNEHIYLWDYFDEEVFTHLSEQLQTLLLRIAPLSKINAQMINQLCETDKGDALLAQLSEQSNLIIKLPKEKNWYACNSFLKNFLLHKSKQINVKPLSDTEVATLWLKHQQADEALPFVLRSEDQHLTITLLQQAGWSLFHDGQFNQLQACFNLIRQSIWLHPELVILKAWMLQSHHQHYKVAPFIKQAEKMFIQHQLLLSQEILSELMVIKAQISINQGRINDALTQAKETLLNHASPSARTNIIAQTIIGEAYHCLGQLDLSYQYFQEVILLASEQDMHQNVIWCLYQQAEILQAQSLHQQAEDHLQKAVELIKKHHLESLPLYAFPLHFRVQRAYQAGEFELADQLCEQALEVIKSYDEQWYLYTYTLQAKVALERGNMQQAKQLINEIERLLRNQNYHSDWIAAANYARLKYWRLNNDIAAIEKWLQKAPTPNNAFNHFDQCHNRNLIRAYIKLGKFDEALQIAQANMVDAQQCQLQMEVNRNLILLTSIETKLQKFSNARQHLHQAVESSLYTGLDTCFIRESENLKPIYQELANDPSMIHAVKNKLMKLLSLSGISLNEGPKNPFDSTAVLKITNHSRTPRLVKNIPLTPREWQVLGLIHSGCRNHEIAHNMGVAPTTIKSHIRNVYQKLGLENRKEALQLSEQLIALI
ncbi:HTH-type transcriptional regulator MalT [Psychromonas sp. psych-6C06]|uniref:HTH-type transcriptional regulator MalT n=1 Tax=Psychromonas sp. psych-6C06 TaxID=2058089 RepID=UPI000C32FA3F|nr:HTH-type transcriptional regulator MalT [Psychromonas sp. psych-6C06]PKF61945.1 HTH-type transcriptional regulator MalT [Psychromonas sp. psych-6C06]